MKIDEIRAMNIDEMHDRLEELRTELFNLRFQKSKNLLDRKDRLRLVRRDIARINTVIKENQNRQ
ncbi:MAG TPA: 50S ribosomal protein L29 [Candidatus Syntrophosphaera sp.]|jgi:large subunit ribosomal protein L29|nr:50S ribosomal protein L29 [Candidatus Syntrophosphaera sp.]